MLVIKIKDKDIYYSILFKLVECLNLDSLALEAQRTGKWGNGITTYHLKQLYELLIDINRLRTHQAYLKSVVT